MIERLLERLEHFDIRKDGDLYLRRFYLYPRSKRRHEPDSEDSWKQRFSIKLHKICRSDEDRDLHDHPWWFISLILKGGYLEETPDGSRVYGRGSLIFHHATDLHKLTVPLPTWTLVVTGRRLRTWGFQTRDGWVPWYNYLGHPNSAEAPSGRWAAGDHS